MKHDKISLSVAFKPRIFGHRGDSSAPEGLEMAGDFCQAVGQAVGALLIFDDGNAFHEIGDGDQVACHSDVDRSSGGAVAGGFGESIVGELAFGERVDNNLF